MLATLQERIDEGNGYIVILAEDAQALLDRLRECEEIVAELRGKNVTIESCIVDEEGVIRPLLLREFQGHEGKEVEVVFVY